MIAKLTEQTQANLEERKAAMFAQRDEKRTRYQEQLTFRLSEVAYRFKKDEEEFNHRESEINNEMIRYYDAKDLAAIQYSNTVRLKCLITAQ